MRKVSDLPQYLIARTVGFPGRLPASGTRCPAHRRNPEARDRAAGAASPRGAWAVTGGRSPSPGEQWMHVLRSGLLAGIYLITTGVITVETCFVTELLLLVLKLTFN